VAAPARRVRYIKLKIIFLFLIITVAAHKNIRLFITHGGRLSIQEAVFHGVPEVVIPFFFDQYLNGERMVEHGVGLRLNYADFDLATFKKHIETVLTNPE